MVNPILVVIACISFLGTVDSYAYNDEISADHQGLRLKRMNQIACHCCSNSFNSHCCLQCMQRVGKRSETSLVHASEPWQNDDTSYLGYESKSFERENEFKPCTCCYYQMHRNPHMESWPCCDECRRRSKRSSDSLDTEISENVDMA